jgi:hypothetical protein
MRIRWKRWVKHCVFGINAVFAKIQSCRRLLHLILKILKSWTLALSIIEWAQKDVKNYKISCMRSFTTGSRPAFQGFGEGGLNQYSFPAVPTRLSGVDRCPSIIPINQASSSFINFLRLWLFRHLEKLAVLLFSDYRGAEYCVWLGMSRNNCVFLPLLGKMIYYLCLKYCTEKKACTKMFATLKIEMFKYIVLIFQVYYCVFKWNEI